VPTLEHQPSSGLRAEISVVIVTYHNATDIAQCLEAAAKAGPRLPMEVIVVDNASGDDTVAMARSAAPDATIIEQPTNVGFAGGCHAGANVASGDWLLFLNPDAFIAPEAIDALLDCALDHPTTGIVGGRFLNEDGTVDPRSWWGRPSPWSALCFALGLSTLFPGNRFFDTESPRPWSSNPDEARVAPVVSGALMLVKRDLWDELGGFDQTFFIYGEDADFCLRAAAVGHRPMVTARAVCHHPGGKSSSGAGKLVMLFTGKCTIVRRHFPPGLRAAGVRLLLIGVFVRATASRWMRLSAPGRGQQRPAARGADWQTLWAARGQWRRGYLGGPARDGLRTR
jgi:N-acetylglucosaminyl-diphospho-decaprenol L-rhamnosyltransferase